MPFLFKFFFYFFTRTLSFIFLTWPWIYIKFLNTNLSRQNNANFVQVFYYYFTSSSSRASKKCSPHIWIAITKQSQYSELRQPFFSLLDETVFSLFPAAVSGIRFTLLVTTAHTTHISLWRHWAILFIKWPILDIVQGFSDK